MKKILKNISPFNCKTEMPTALFVVKKLLAFLFCYISGMFIAEGIVMFLHLAMGYNVLQGEMLDFQTMSLMKYYGYVIFIAVVLGYWKIVEKKPLSMIGLNKGFGSYFIGVGISVLLLTLSIGGIMLLGKIKYQGIFDNINVSMLLLFTGGFIVQGAMEEVLCRGLLLHTLKEKVTLPLAVLISTVVFILPHWWSLFSGEIIYGVIGIINLTLISIVFSLLTIKQKSIWAACGLHSFWNAILYSFLGLNLSGNDEMSTAVFAMKSVGENVWNGGIYGIEASLITTVVLGMFAAIIWVKIISHQKIKSVTESGKNLPQLVVIPKS